MATEDKTNMPPKCCEEINPGHYGSSLRKRLPKRLVELYNLKRQEFALKRPVYCPAEDCGEWIQPSMIHHDARTGRAVGTCPKCHERVCYKCRQKSHGSQSCEQGAEEAINDLVRNNRRFQRCYRCHNVVERTEGCSHMTCRCGAQFCHLCGAPWDTRNQRCQSDCGLQWAQPPDPEATFREFMRNDNAAAAQAGWRDPFANVGPRPAEFDAWPPPAAVRAGRPPRPPSPPGGLVRLFPRPPSPPGGLVRLPPNLPRGRWPPPPPPRRNRDLITLERVFGF
jgi:hypothetical protein